MSSHSRLRMRVADIPSAMQWWIFISIAHRLPFRPSMTQHSQSGRSRSQAALQHVGDNSEQFGVIARPRHRDSAHVAAEIESRIVDPLRRTDVEGLGAEHLRAARNRLNTLCQNTFELFKVGRGAVDDRDSADRQTDVTVRILGHEETRVERIELLHEPSPPFRRLGLCSSIGGDQRSEVAAILNRVNNWSRLCGNVVRRDSTRVEEAGCLRISEHFLTPRQECSGAEHFSRMTCIRVTDADSVMG